MESPNSPPSIFKDQTWRSYHSFSICSRKLGELKMMEDEVAALVVDNGSGKSDNIAERTNEGWGVFFVKKFI